MVPASTRSRKVIMELKVPSAIIRSAHLDTEGPVTPAHFAAWLSDPPVFPLRLNSPLSHITAAASTIKLRAALLTDGEGVPGVGGTVPACELAIDGVCHTGDVVVRSRLVDGGGGDRCGGGGAGPTTDDSDVEAAFTAIM